MTSRTGSDHAVIWDFDGTLVDTRERNLSVAREIITAITTRPADEFEALASMTSFKAATMRARNWRDLYAREFGLSNERIDQAGALWAEFQSRATIASPLIDGIGEALNALDHLPHGIVSQNAKAIIAGILDANEVGKHFQAIIGYEEVAMTAQKPSPDGLMQCIDTLTAFRFGYVFYVGDHEADTICANNARNEIARREVPVEVVAIAALFEGETTNEWEIPPDHVARHPSDIRDVVLERVGD